MDGRHFPPGKTSLKMSVRLENVKAYSETLSRLKSPKVAIFFVPILLKSVKVVLFTLTYDTLHKTGLFEATSGPLEL